MFQFFRRDKKDEFSLKKELEKLRTDINRIDSDVTVVFNTVNELIQMPQKTMVAVSDLQRKVDDIFNVTRLTLQNHEVIQEQTKRLAELESSFNTLRVSLESSHIPREVIRSEKTPIGHFSDTSVNSVNSSLNYQLKSGIRSDFSGLQVLTDMEKKTFATLAALIRENETKEAHIEPLVRELYPEFPVGKRRSTVSNFLKKLEGFGLIAKHRRGRTKTISLTEKGLKVIGEEAFKHLEKSLIKK